ncbi:monovalent cation/H(+) antiporter subunit G [Nitrosovibrio sp. Nv17]|uniref:monovalent cation/H(+) antiporter subunit G n=1 Tax=Nitrosovibrio sp. Nv17 TaxID=1855339 RepID=UPI000908898E|nr:monovalent cation/H(+) antiporter subunit G [Nitrosovibrio sp. Nv17]SFW13926.1 multisubunit potassium/proton antiporter, PhaG subunit [Nitrosovibrio sp. Nv17]
MSGVQFPLWADLLASLLLIVGATLALIGSFGLLRLSGLFARIHAPTLGATLGLGCVLLASILLASVGAHRLVLQEVLITLFMVGTAPVTAMLLMRAGMYRRREDGSRKPSRHQDTARPSTGGASPE